MKSVLNELYCGRIFPMEQIVPTDPKYPELGRRIDAELEELKQKLDTEDGKRLEQFNSDNLEMCSISEYAGFTHGIRLGVRMMCEIFGGETK